LLWLNHVHVRDHTSFVYCYIWHTYIFACYIPLSCVHFSWMGHQLCCVCHQWNHVLVETCGFTLYSLFWVWGFAVQLSSCPAVLLSCCPAALLPVLQSCYTLTTTPGISKDNTSSDLWSKCSWCSSGRGSTTHTTSLGGMATSRMHGKYAHKLCRINSLDWLSTSTLLYCARVAVERCL